MIKVMCNWGFAEDICIAVNNGKPVVFLNKDEARTLAEQLLRTADICDKLENEFEKDFNEEDILKYSW